MKPHEIIASLRWWRAPGEGMPWLLLSGPWPYGDAVYGRVERGPDGRFVPEALCFGFGHWPLVRGNCTTSERVAKEIVLEAAEAAVVNATKYYAERAVAYANSRCRTRAVKRQMLPLRNPTAPPSARGAA